MAKFQVPNARFLIADLTPPVILRPALKLWHRARGLGFHTFEGSYASLADVPCGEGRYDDDEIAQSIVAYAMRHIDEIGTPKKIIDSTGHLILPMIASQFLK